MDAEIFGKHRDELAGMWQGRVLRATRREPLGLVVLSMLAHNWPDAYVAMLYAAFPDFRGELHGPIICSSAKINKAGYVVADMVWPDRPFPQHDYPIFRNELHMRDAFRKLADRLKLSDQDRLELFTAARNWCCADQRLDPNFDPADPDAKRIVTH